MTRGEGGVSGGGERWTDLAELTSPFGEERVNVHQRREYLERLVKSRLVTVE